MMGAVQVTHYPSGESQQDPLPLAPNEAEAIPDSQLVTHQYADLDEIRSRKGHAPPPTVLDDVNSQQGTLLVWNISNEILLSSSPDRGITINTLIAQAGVSKLSVVLNSTNSDLHIQCQACPGSLGCNIFSPPQYFSNSTDPVQVIAFGPPNSSSLSHELRENATVKLSWSPPLVEAVLLFTYNIIIMESTDNSLTVTNINITNNTYVIISPRDIVQYTQCKEYQWGVRAAGSNVSLHGFTNITIAATNFTIISAPFVSDELIISVNDSTSYSLHFNVSLPCEYNDLFNNYTYTLLQRDYCKREINSSLIEITSEQIDDNDGSTVSISVSIESLIHNSTWSVAVSVSNRFGSDTTDYTNVTGNITSNKCYSESIPSSSSIKSTSFFNVATSIQTSFATVIITSTIYITATPSTNESNVIPIVIGTTITVMILLIAAIILLINIFIALICCKRTATEVHQDGRTNAVELETCPAYVSDSVSLYPSESIVAPFESPVSFNCSFSFTSQQGTLLAWNVSNEILLSSSPDRGITINTLIAQAGVSKLSVVLNSTNSDLHIQCQACPGSLGCNIFSPPQYFSNSTDPVQVIAFGPPNSSSLSHELRENATVKLSWLPPLVEAVPLFTYNIIIMESTNNSLMVTDINITNNTYVIISPANITNYTECTSYQWGVRAAANLSYGFTNVTMANEAFTLISGPKISDELTVIDDNYTIEFNVTAPCDIDLLNNYTYTLLQRDYCQTELNSSQLNISIPLDDNVLPNAMIPINISIESLIHDLTWSVAVNLSNRFGSNTTDYTNITNNSEIIQNCNPMTSSSVSQESSSNILSSLITYTVSPISSTLSTLSISSPTPSVTPSGESGSSNTIIVTAVGGGGGGAVVLLCITIVTCAVCKVKNNRKSYDMKDDVNKVEDLNVIDTSMVIESPRITVKSSPVDSTDIVNEDYNSSPVGSSDIVNEDYNSHHVETSFETHLPGNPDPTYQEPVKALSQVKAVPPSATKPQEYSTPVNTPSTFAPQLSETKPAIDTELIQDTPGYTEVPAHMKKSTGSKKKQETKNQNDPLPLAPNDETEATPDSKLATHQYADLDEIRSRKGRPPPPTVINDVNYSEVITS
uniref:Fibronectin type-III domain-containing protein n=1 Tax=Amphimedon queenslandica TaxID=400682 RepID=A0A1X7UEU7_AMPQE